MTRLGLFNPKLLKHDYLKNMNPEKLLKIKTSTWLKEDTNEILINSHIPSEIVKSPVFETIPDENNNILTENILDKYFLYEDKIFYKETGKIVIDVCINGIKTYTNFQINYVEPNMLLTWNFPKTLLNQICINKEISIVGSNLVKILNFSIQLDEFTFSNSMLDYTQSVYINNNIIKLEPLSYIQTKETIESHEKYYNVFQIITLTTFVIIMISILLYLWYNFKSIPRKLIVKYEKTKGRITKKYSNFKRSTQSD